MKNKLRLIVSLIVVCLIITGCDGTITRDIRRDGYSIGSSKFLCGFFINKSKEENVSEKVKFLTNNYIISEKGYVYELSLDKMYSNQMNCRKGGNLGTKVVGIMDESIVKGSDGGFYYLNTDNPASRYTRVTNADEKYDIYKLILGDTGVVKVVTVNESIHNYFVLKADGSIYNYVLTKDEKTDKFVLNNPTIELSRNVYGPIIDFNYAGESSSTYYRTATKLYTYKIKNEKDCNKYVDIPCEYKLQNDTTLVSYLDRIIAFNGNTIITDYGRVFKAGS